MSTALESLPPALRSNPAAQSLVKKYQNAVAAKSEAREQAKASASVSAGMKMGVGGALVGTVEVIAPSMEGVEILGLPWALWAGGLGVIAGASMGSATAVDVAGGILACGVRDAVKAMAPKKAA